MVVENLTMSTTERFVGAIPAYPDPNGFVAEDGVTPARVGSVPLWESLDTNVCTVTFDEDGMTNLQILSADMQADDPPRTGQVRMTVDVDLEGGVATLELLWNVTVTAPGSPNAAGLGSSIFGSAIPK